MFVFAYTNAINAPLAPSKIDQAHTAGIMRVEHSQFDMISEKIRTVKGKTSNH